MLFSKKIQKIYKSRMFVRYDDHGTAFYFSEKDFSGLNKTPYAFTTPKGNKLQGCFYSYETPIEGRLVIFDHGMGAGHTAYMREIEMLAKHGFLVFSYDHTGCMESEGESVDGFATSIADLDAAINTLKSDEKYKKLRLSVIGHSWGGLSTQNICAFHPDITHIVALSGPVSVEAIVIQSFGGILKGYRKDIMALEAEANPEYVGCSAVDALKDFQGKALIIHSADDSVVFQNRHFDALKAALGDKENIRFLSVNGKDHNPNYSSEALKLLKEYQSSLKEKLKKGELKTAEQKNEFISRFDWRAMTEQDETVWNEIFKTLDE